VGLELATEKRDEMTVFGEDYPTRDGTCIRDYIHVSDLALAHYKAVNFLLANDEVSEIFNCGYGTGYTVKEVMGKIESIIGKKLNIKMGSRRPGDPCALVANSSKIADKLNWQPQYNSLDTIIQTALAWEKEIQ